MATIKEGIKENSCNQNRLWVGEAYSSRLWKLLATNAVRRPEFYDPERGKKSSCEGSFRNCYSTGLDEG